MFDRAHRRSPFEPRTEKERKEDQARMEAATEKYNSAIEKARACLESQLFKDYRADYEAAAHDLFELLMDLPATDPVQFAFQADGIRHKIKALRALGVQVQTIASLTPRVAPKKAEDQK